MAEMTLRAARRKQRREDNERLAKVAKYWPAPKRLLPVQEKLKDPVRKIDDVPSLHKVVLDHFKAK
jgi:hypothetical protein